MGFKKLPEPSFGRPGHLGFPHRLRPGASPQALRIPPRGGHPALRSTASGGFRLVLAVSSFRFRARLDLSIPSAFSGQRGCEPRFLIWRPHLSARGTSTLLNKALLSAYFRLADREFPRPSGSYTATAKAFDWTPAVHSLPAGLHEKELRIAVSPTPGLPVACATRLSRARARARTHSCDRD